VDMTSESWIDAVRPTRSEVSWRDVWVPTIPTERVFIPWAWADGDWDELEDIGGETWVTLGDDEGNCVDATIDHPMTPSPDPV
jgi:hypothetical protein